MKNDVWLRIFQLYPCSLFTFRETQQTLTKASASEIKSVDMAKRSFQFSITRFHINSFHHDELPTKSLELMQTQRD